MATPEPGPWRLRFLFVKSVEKEIVLELYLTSNGIDRVVTVEPIEKQPADSQKVKILLARTFTHSLFMSFYDSGMLYS